MAKTYKELQKEIEDLEYRIKTLEVQNELIKTTVNSLTASMKTASSIFESQRRINEYTDKQLDLMKGKIYGDDV